MNIQDLLDIAVIAQRTPALPGPEWPPSIYYRYIAEVVHKTNANVFVELGTCGGGCARNVAIRNPNTKVITIDIEKLPQAELAAQQNQNMCLCFGDSIAMADTLGPTYDRQIGVMFFDTVHEHDHVMREFNAWRPYLAQPAVLCFDDLYRLTMDRVWDELPGAKTSFHALKEMHIGGSAHDGGFGALIL